MSTEDLRKDIIAYMKEAERSSMDSVAFAMNRLDYTDEAIYPILQDLLDEGIIEHSGTIRYVGEETWVKPIY